MDNPDQTKRSHVRDKSVIDHLADKVLEPSGIPNFVSRGDRSGTNALELRLWNAADLDAKPIGGGVWYRDIGRGMGQALETPKRCLPPPSDRGRG